MGKRDCSLVTQTVPGDQAPWAAWVRSIDGWSMTTSYPKHVFSAQAISLPDDLHGRLSHSASRHGSPSGHGPGLTVCVRYHQFIAR